MDLVVRDTASAALSLLDAKLKNTTAISEAAGLAVVSLTTRSFNDESVRATPWAPLKPETIERKLKLGLSSAILKAHGILWRSYRIIETTNDTVRVGTDRPQAGYLQFGTSRGLPPRPMLPLWGSSPQSAVLTPLAVKRIRSAALAALKAML